MSKCLIVGNLMHWLLYLAGADEGRQYEREHDQSGSGGARGRGRPPGLRGKDIGMYYARMGRAKRASKDRAQVFSQGLKFYNLTESSCSVGRVLDWESMGC